MEDPLYKEIILEHWQNPKNFGVIKKPDFDETDFNPTCGDKIRITGKIKNGKLIEFAFTSIGCAISKASASILSEEIKGKEIKKILNLKEKNILKNFYVEISPARYNCALLGFRCLKKALE